MYACICYKHVFLFKVSPETEMKIAVQALRLNTHSKLTFTDSKRFDSLIQDVFPDVPFQDVEHQELEQALRDACKEANLVVIESQVRPYVQLSMFYSVCSVHELLHMYVCSYICV